MASIYDVLRTKDIVSDRLRGVEQARGVTKAIEDEEKKKAQWALGLALLGGLINPAFAIAGGIAGRHGADFFIKSEEETVDPFKYSPSESREFNEEIARVQRRLDREDYGKDVKMAITTLMLGGLTDKIAEMGVGKAITEKSTWTTWGGKRGPLSLSNLFGDWSFGGGG